MNYKELREAWRDFNHNMRYQDRLDSPIANKVEDWFIARIKERDERLKEKILKDKTGYCLDDICSETEYAIPVDKLLEIIDNHA